MLKHGELLLLVQGDVGAVAARNPGVLESCGPVIPLRRRVRAESQKEISRQRTEIVRKVPFYGLRLNFLQLLAVVYLSRGVARMLSAGQKLV